MSCGASIALGMQITVDGWLRVEITIGTGKQVNATSRGNKMNFLICHECDIERWSVDLGKGGAGFSSVEALLKDFYKHEIFSIREEEGFWYPNYETEQPAQKCDRWKLYRHEVYYPKETASYDAIVVLFYQPVNITELEPEKQLIPA